jgi:hypothetical protein
MRAFDFPSPANAAGLSTFDRNSDNGLDRRRMLNRLSDRPEALLGMVHCRLRGPLPSQWVKGANSPGEARKDVRKTWELFTPCTQADSLLEAVSEAAKCATPGDVALRSPACSSFDQFRNSQQRGKCFVGQRNQSVVVAAKATTISAAMRMTLPARALAERSKCSFKPDSFEEEARSKVTQNNHDLKERTLKAPKENE